MTDWPGQAVGQEWPGTPAKSSSPSEKNTATTKLYQTEGQPSRGVLDQLLGLNGPRYQLWPERAVRSIAGLPEEAIKAANIAPGTREGTEAMIKPAAETAMATLAPEARVGRAAVEGAAPAIEELLGGYAGAKDIFNTPLQSHVLPELKDNILNALHEEHHRDYLSPGVYRAISELESTAGKTPTVFDIEGVRRVLGNVPHTERAAASIARDKINDYLAGLQPEDIIGGKNAGQALGQIRGNYAAGKRSELVTGAMEKGERRAEKSGSGANLDNTLRQEIDKILNNPKLLRGFSEEEKQQMRAIVKGGKIGNAARLLSKLGPKHPITGWGAAVASDLKGGMGMASASLGIGQLAQMIAEASTRNKIGALEEAIRRRSPLYKQQMAPAQPPMMPGLANPLTRLGVGAGLGGSGVMPGVEKLLGLDNQ